jgi:Mor family transcriptional regulator
VNAEDRAQRNSEIYQRRQSGELPKKLAKDYGLSRSWTSVTIRREKIARQIHQ